MKKPALNGAVWLVGALALPALFLAACEPTGDVVLAGAPQLSVESSMTTFPETDPILGTSETIVVEARNSGGGEITLAEIRLEGPDAKDFELRAAESMTLRAGEATAFEVAFRPRSHGLKSARLSIMSDVPGQVPVQMAVRGRAAQFKYEQVDRKGIPGLNTVFNHPSGIGPFDKTAYNVASPANDLAVYTGLFETVLAAVANPDPAATAALLLPDELPVNMGAAETNFATLTGRALDDDAIDVALSVTVGIESLQSDNVDSNDKAFRADFPYVAAPHR